MLITPLGGIGPPTEAGTSQRQPAAFDSLRIWPSPARAGAATRLQTANATQTRLMSPAAGSTRPGASKLTNSGSTSRDETGPKVRVSATGLAAVFITTSPLA